jgi:hypothetical protein
MFCGFQNWNSTDLLVYGQFNGGKTLANKGDK